MLNHGLVDKLIAWAATNNGGVDPDRRFARYVAYMTLCEVARMGFLTHSAEHVVEAVAPKGETHDQS